MITRHRGTPRNSSPGCSRRFQNAQPTGSTCPRPMPQMPQECFTFAAAGRRSGSPRGDPVRGRRSCAPSTSGPALTMLFPLAFAGCELSELFANEGQAGGRTGGEPAGRELTHRRGRRPATTAGTDAPDGAGQGGTPRGPHAPELPHTGLPPSRQIRAVSAASRQARSTLLRSIQVPLPRGWAGYRPRDPPCWSTGSPASR